MRAAIPAKSRGTHAHRLGHRPSRLRIVRLLQACHLLITTGHHGAHHRASHNRRYCVINGWANYVCDGTGFWRALELLVQQLTGSVPRRNDLEWLARHQHR
jgi:ubiquitin-conjugating enzyme E2 variant